MSITYHRDLVQGSDEWRAARCGLITASEMHLLLTTSLKIASNDKQRTHVYELAAQRISRYVEPSFISDDMLRGHEDEVEARALYAKHHSPVEECGFVTNDEWGFTLGCSPDGLVGDCGMVECKSRRQKYQVATVVSGKLPAEYALQVQTALLVTGRNWCDFVSYSGGLPMVVLRVLPDAEVQEAIIKAATLAEHDIAVTVSDFLRLSRGMLPTERRIEQEMFA